MKCVDIYPQPEADVLLAVGQANGKVVLCSFGPSAHDSAGVAGMELSKETCWYTYCIYNNSLFTNCVSMQWTQRIVHLIWTSYTVGPTYIDYCHNKLNKSGFVHNIKNERNIPDGGIEMLWMLVQKLYIELWENSSTLYCVFSIKIFIESVLNYIVFKLMRKIFKYMRVYLDIN